MSARDIIRRSEGLRLKAYPDPGSGGAPWTIGYGHTRNVRRGDTCSAEQAEVWLDEDLGNALSVIDRAVQVPLSPQQRDALASFVFNVGGPAFVGSTLLKLLNTGDYSGAAAQFPRWNKASGHILPGLVTRRGEERALFLSGTDIHPEPIPAIEETPMLPLAATILVNAMPSLINALPEIASIFKKPDVAERNVEAVTKVGQILMQSTGAANMQEAVEKVQDDPQAAATANEALRMNRADLLDAMERAWEKDEASVSAARDYSSKDAPLFGGWHFVHILSLILVVLGGGAAVYVLWGSNDPTERAMALQTLLLVGFSGVISFWLGSSRSSQMKDLLREKS